MHYPIFSIISDDEGQNECTYEGIGIHRRLIANGVGSLWEEISFNSLSIVCLTHVWFQLGCSSNVKLIIIGTEMIEGFKIWTIKFFFIKIKPLPHVKIDGKVVSCYLSSLNTLFLFKKKNSLVVGEFYVTQVDVL